MKKSRIILASLLSLIIFSSLFGLVLAATDPEPQLVVKFGDLNPNLKDNTFGSYIATVYKWAIGVGALLAVLMIIFGAVEYVASAGNVGSRQNAVGRIQNAALGLALLLGVVLIATIINPKMLNLSLSGQNYGEFQKQKKIERAKQLLSEIKNSHFSFNQLLALQPENVELIEKMRELSSMVHAENNQNYLDINLFDFSGALQENLKNTINYLNSSEGEIAARTALAFRANTSPGDISQENLESAIKSEKIYRISIIDYYLKDAAKTVRDEGAFVGGGASGFVTPYTELENYINELRTNL